MDLSSFQRDHGAEWNAIVQSPAFGAAMQRLNLSKIQEITALTKEDIETKGKLILADLVGHLNHENDLMRLATAEDLAFKELQPDYPDAAQEAYEQSLPPGKDEPTVPPAPKFPKPKKRK